MKMKNLKVNSGACDPKLKLKREVYKSAATVIASGLVTAGGCTITRTMIMNNVDPFLILGMVGLSYYAASLFGDSIRNYVDATKKQKHLKLGE